MTYPPIHQKMPFMPAEKVELLAPAGNFEKLEVAIHYGADAIYLGGKAFSLRNLATNFSMEEMSKAIRFAHSHGVKVYVACNIFSRNIEQNAIADYLRQLGEFKPDAVIIADPGIFMIAKHTIAHIPIHLSTQANTTNYNSVLFWEKLGIKRINIARELSLSEIMDIASKSAVEIEAFVHGAMCMAYSGRCLLSNYLTHRDSNHGDCSHSCRWKYAVVEELRPGQYIPVSEDDRGTYIFSSKDLCMIQHIDKLIQTGVSSLKIEGRMKGINYLASTVKTYREAIDTYYETPKDYVARKKWVEELSRGNYRGFCTGFYMDDANQLVANYSGPKPILENRLAGQVKRILGQGLVQVMVHSKLVPGDTVEIFKHRGPCERASVEAMQDENGYCVSVAQPGSLANIQLSANCAVYDLIRKVNFP